MLSRFLTVLLATFVVTVYGGFEVLESSANRLVVRWVLDTVSVQPAGETTVRVDVEPANTDIVREGVVLPAYSFVVGLPAQGVSSFSFSAGRVTTRTLGGKQLHRGEGAGGALEPPPVLSSPWLVGGEVQQMGRLRVQQFVLVPVEPDASAGVCRILHEATLVIEFPPPGQRHRLPANEYYRTLESLVVNYPVAREWGVPPGSSRLSKQQTASFPLSADRVRGVFTVGDGHSGFNETTTFENGLMRIDGVALRALLGSGFRFDRLALYGGRKQELSSDSLTGLDQIPQGIVRTPFLPFDLNGNGRIDDEDYIVLWVSATSDWLYDSSGGRFDFALNRYDDYRRYWLVEHPQRVEPVPRFTQPEGEAGLQEHFTDRIRLKGYEGEQSFPTDGRAGTIDWIWQRLSSSRTSTRAYTLNRTRINTSRPGFARVASRTRQGMGRLELVVGGSTLLDEAGIFRIPAMGWGDAIVSARLHVPSDIVEVEHLDVFWESPLVVPPGEQLIVYAPDTLGLARWSLAGLPPDEITFIFRIPPNEEQITLVDTVRAGSDGRFFWTDSIGTGVRYGIAPASALKHPPADLAVWKPVRHTLFTSDLAPFHLSDLRPVANRSDHLIVTHDDFLDQALRLAEHKYQSKQARYPRVVRIDDVYREFSGGTVDPAALRNFLAYARFGWEQEELVYVTLMGSGHWDYKGILPRTRHPVFIPVYQTRENTFQLCADDFFARLMGGGFADVFLGRIPCRTPDEAATVVDKIIEMEATDKADFGPWRNRVLLVSDDDMQGPNFDGVVHHTSSEKVGDTIMALQPAVDLKKLYLFEYPPNDLHEKPAVNQALVNHINNGIAVVNYFGHGAGDVWADEHILLVSDIAKMRNTRRYPLVNSLSCSVGKFDDPREVSLSEHLLLARGGGAIGAISATREAWASQNERFAVSLYHYLYEPGYSRSVGQAYMLARARHRTSRELRAYALLGDPSIRFVHQTHDVVLTIQDADDAAGTNLDTLMALQPLLVEGTIRSRSGGSVDRTFGSSAEEAFVHLGLFNPALPSRRKDDGTREVSYTLPGSPLFAGKVAVVNGRFSQKLLVPRNVVFDTDGVRLTAYAWRTTEAALGDRSGLVFSATRASAVTDTVGPTIAVRPVYDDPAQNSAATFTDHLVVGAPVRFGPLAIAVHVFDENGIDVVGSGPGEGLTVEIPGVLQKQSLNHLFQFVEGEYRQGNALLVLEEGEIGAGEYELRLSARDLLGNQTSKKVGLVVVPNEELNLSHVFNFPNPMTTGGTTRFFYHSSLRRVMYQGRPFEDLDIVLQIHTLSGRLLRTFVNPSNGVEWDGTDQFGRRLPPNVYLYQFRARTPIAGGQEQKSPIMKIVIHPPRR